jgi:tryptophan-rich sensory protein
LSLGAGVLMLAGAVVRIVSGSPYTGGLLLRFAHRMPPVWLMSLGWLVWYGLLGAAFVGTLCRAARSSPAARAEIYRGGMLFLCMIFLGFLWYPLFFAAGAVLLSAVLLIAILALCLACAIAYLSVCRPAAIILFCHAAWLLWLAVIHIAVLFS